MSAKRQANPVVDLGANQPLAVYLHWPYCARICPYCDFNVHLDKRADEGDALAAAMAADLAYWREWTGPRTIGSVHFGGGTPSLLKGPQLDALLGAVDQLWGLPQGAEMALEANPNDITPARLAVWQAAKLSRLSIGVQSFDDGVLKRLGRDHDGAAARRAISGARNYVSSVSADLIFGVEGERSGRLADDLDILLDLGVQHISTYQLTVEPGTAFAKAEARGEGRAVDPDRSAADFDFIRERLKKAGYRHYEVSNFAKPGDESRHNLAYWRGDDYIGVGPGAHGRLWTEGARVATETALRPADYIRAVADNGTGITERDALSCEAASEEYLLMGLRIREGVSLPRLNAMRGQNLTIDQDLIDGGWLEIKGDRLCATERGRTVLDAVTRRLLL